MHGRVGPWSGSREETRWFSAVGARRRRVLREAGVPFEIVPGVTAGLGVTAYAGIPVTHRGAASAVAFVTGHGDPECEPGHGRLDWSALARFPGYARRLHGSHSSRGDLPHLDAAGKAGDTPAAVIEAGTLPSQRTQVGTLETIAPIALRSGHAPPALLVVGSVVELRDNWNGLSSLPLFGQRIVITRPRRRRVSRGGRSREPWEPKCSWRRRSRCRPITDPAPLDAAIDRLDRL